MPSIHNLKGARMRAAGLRPVQFWVPDTRSPEFAADVHKQCQKLQGDPAETEVLRFTAEAATQLEGWECCSEATS